MITKLLLIPQIVRGLQAGVQAVDPRHEFLRKVVVLAPGQQRGANFPDALHNFVLDDTGLTAGTLVQTFHHPTIGSKS